MSASRWAILVPLFSASLGCTAANFFVMQGDDGDSGLVGEQRSEPPVPDGTPDGPDPLAEPDAPSADTVVRSEPDAPTTSADSADAACVGMGNWCGFHTNATCCAGHCGGDGTCQP